MESTLLVDSRKVKKKKKFHYGSWLSAVEAAKQNLKIPGISKVHIIDENCEIKGTVEKIRKR